MASRQRRPRDVQARFNKAVSVVQSLPKDGPFQPSNMMKLKFYAFYKQATIGPCNISKPGFWDVAGRAKWEAWNMAGNMPKEEAMLNYVEELQKIVETMPQSKEVEEFLSSIGPFYEEVEEPPAQPPNKDTSENEPTNSPKLVITTDTVTTETVAEETEESKEAKSDSEEDIFSDPIATPESLSPLLSPHHPLKSPSINSSSEGELSDEYVVVGNRAKASMQATAGNTSKREDTTSGDTEHDGTPAVVHQAEHTSNAISAVTVAADEQSAVVMTGRLEKVQRDLQSILHRLNSLELLLKRRRGAQARWWLRPFSNLSWLALVIMIVWPILVNILWRKLRRYTDSLFISRH